MSLRQTAVRHPLKALFVVEGMMIPIGLFLAWVFGVQPWAHYGVSGGILLGALLATLPLLAMLALFSAWRPAWFDEIESYVNPLIASMFRGRGVAPVLLAAALAGVGEELLFRGVLQAALAGPIGPWPAMVLAGGLFGAMHAVTRAYFVLAAVMGLYLGALYLLTGNLLLPSAVHALYDAVAIGYLLRQLGPPARSA